MSSEEITHSASEIISNPDKDLEKNNAEEITLEQCDAPVIQHIKEKQDLLVSNKLEDEDLTTLKSCKEQEVKVEKDCDNSSVSTIENMGNVDDPSTSKDFKGQEDLTKNQENIATTTPSENEDKNSETGFNSNTRNEEVKCQEDRKQTITEPCEDSKSQDGNDPKPSKEAKYLQIGSQKHPKQTTTSETDTGNNAETSEDVPKKRHFRWLRFPKSSKEDKLQKNEGERTNAETKQEEQRYNILHVNICGSYLLAIGLMFVCVVIILGGFFWRIGYAIAGFHEDFLNDTACQTLNPPSNDSNDTDHSVLKVLQKMWRNESNKLVSD